VTQAAHVGFGSERHLAAALDALAPHSILLLTGRTSFSASGAEDAVGHRLSGRRVHRLSHAGGPPQVEGVRQGIAEFRSFRPDVVVAVGGGSVLDMAKLVALLAVQPGAPAALTEYVTGDRPIERDACPLIALPTTAGSGSEATHFAVVYHDKRKYSVAHASVLPRVAIVDPQFTMTLTPRQTAISGFDALSQAVESYWSVNSTDVSRERSRRAVGLALEHLSAAVRRPTRAARAGMAEAAFLAGQAIDIARTTAPHAVSYGMTAWFDVPHGQAVAVTLPHFFRFNAATTPEDTTDRRGAAFVRQTIGELNEMLGARSAEESCARLQALMREVGLATTLESLGISSAESRQRILEGVNPERMINNPRAVTSGQLQEIVANA
jgi:alcohol dehydrogenase class IV